MALLVALGLVQPALGQSDFEAQVEATMADLQWGMRHREVFDQIEERIQERHRPALKAATGAIEQDRVLARAREDTARVKRDFVVFDGRVSGWDVSAIGPEFRRNTHEAMLVFEDERSKNHYFFMRGRLWKWYRQFHPDAFGGADFDTVGQALMRKFGPAQERIGERVDGGGPERWLEWSGKRTRVTVIDRGTHIVLLLTDLRVHAQLATLRRNALPRRAQRKHKVLDAILMSEEEREAFRAQR